MFGRRRATILFAAGALIASSSGSRVARATPPRHDFVFESPDGWIDLTRGAPRNDADRLTADVREASERLHPDTVLYAAAPGEDAVMSVMLRPESESEPIDDEALSRAGTQLGWKSHFVVEDERIERVDGLAWGRFAGTTDKRSRFVVYLVPGRPQSAFIMFSAPPSSFDRLLPSFEAAAKRTRGAAAPEGKSHFPIETAILGAIAAGFVVWRVRRSKARATSRDDAAVKGASARTSR